MKFRAAFLIVLFVAGPADAASKPKRDATTDALSDPERLVQIGNHARASGDMMLALSFYERALELDAGNLAALRAATEVALGVRMPQALGLAERWVSKAPRDGLAHLAVGAALVQQNRPTEAAKSIDLAAAAGGPLAAVSVQRGLAYDLLGESRRAQLAFADAMQQAPGDRSIVEYLALSLAIGGDDAAAIELLRPEAEGASGQPSFERTLVLVHALAGRVDIARRIAATSLPAEASGGMGSLLERIAALPTPSQRAAAVHLGILPDAGRTAPPQSVRTEPVVTVPQRDVPRPEVAASAPAPTAALPAQILAPAVKPQPASSPARTAAVTPTAKPPELKPAAPVKPAVKTPPKPEPMPAGMLRLGAAQLRGEHIWLQLSSSGERALLPNDHARFKKKARGMLDGYNAYVQNAGTTHRLIVGPFKSMADALRAKSRLKAAGVDALASRIPAGSSISPL